MSPAQLCSRKFQNPLRIGSTSCRFRKIVKIRCWTSPRYLLQIRIPLAYSPSAAFRITIISHELNPGIFTEIEISTCSIIPRGIRTCSSKHSADWERTSDRTLISHRAQIVGKACPSQRTTKCRICIRVTWIILQRLVPATRVIAPLYLRFPERCREYRERKYDIPSASSGHCLLDKDDV